MVWAIIKTLRTCICSQNPALLEDLAIDIEIEFQRGIVYLGKIREALGTSRRFSFQAVIVDDRELTDSERDYLCGALAFGEFQLVVYAPESPARKILGDRVAYARSLGEVLSELRAVRKRLDAPRPNRAPSEGQSRSLTVREHEIAQLVVRGFTNKRIAETLAIKELTVRNAVNEIMRKLRCPTRAEIASSMSDQ